MKKKAKQHEIPAELDTPEFHSSWSDWQEHRKQLRKKMTPICMKRQIAKLAKWSREYGVEYAIASLEQSMEMGWTGLFEPIPSQMMKHAGSAALTTRQMYDRGLLN